MSYTIDLSGRVALITGASSGLGAQFARTLAKAGAAVVLAGRRVERLKDLRSEIEALGGDAHVVGLDVTDVASIRAAVAHAETEVGPLDILINNSGVSTSERLVDVTEDGYDYVFDTNTKGSFCGAGSCQAHVGPRQGFGARHLHRWAHRQHCFGCRPAHHAANRRVLHEQSRRHSHDQGHGR